MRTVQAFALPTSRVVLGGHLEDEARKNHLILRAVVPSRERASRLHMDTKPEIAETSHKVTAIRAFAAIVVALAGLGAGLAGLGAAYYGYYARKDDYELIANLVILAETKAATPARVVAPTPSPAPSPTPSSSPSSTPTPSRSLFAYIVVTEEAAPPVDICRDDAANFNAVNQTTPLSARKIELLRHLARFRSTPTPLQKMARDNEDAALAQLEGKGRRGAPMPAAPATGM